MHPSKALNLCAELIALKCSYYHTQCFFFTLSSSAFRGIVRAGRQVHRKSRWLRCFIREIGDAVAGGC